MDGFMAAGRLVKKCRCGKPSVHLGAVHDQLSRTSRRGLETPKLPCGNDWMLLRVAVLHYVGRGARRTRRPGAGETEEVAVGISDDEVGGYPGLELQGLVELDTVILVLKEECLGTLDRNRHGEQILLRVKHGMSADMTQMEAGCVAGDHALEGRFAVDIVHFESELGLVELH